MRQQDPQQTLKDSKLIACLPRGIRDEFVSRCKIRVYEPRERILIAGDPIIGPSWVEQGLVRVYLTGDTGEEHPLTFTWPGEVALPTFGSGPEWRADAKAVAPTTHAAIPRVAFVDLAERNSAISLALLEYATILVWRRQHWDAQLRALTLRPRILQILGRIADELGTPTAEGILLDFPLTHGTLACATVSSRDEASRAMRDLEEWGYYQSRPRHRILIPDRERLRTYVSPEQAEA